MPARAGLSRRPKHLYFAAATRKKITAAGEIFCGGASDTEVAVTVSRVSVVDRMVSKEYVQTARPYDRDLASPGAWIETGLSSRGPRWVTVTAFIRTFVSGTGLLTRDNFQREK